MNYLKLYIKLIRKAQQRDPKDLEGIYTERHHIFPKSIFGNNNLLVRLTYKEHVVAHHLIQKACIRRYGFKHNYTIKMNFALNMFLGMKNRSKIYGTRALINYIRLSNKVKLTHTESTRKIMSLATKGDSNPAYDSTRRNWYNVNTKAVEPQITTFELRSKYIGLNKRHLSDVVHKKLPQHKGWVVVDCSIDSTKKDIAKIGQFQYDSYLQNRKLRRKLNLNYNWHNALSDTVHINLSCYKMHQLYHDISKRKFALIAKGILEEHQGWTILDDTLTANND